MTKTFCRWMDTSPYYIDLMNTDGTGHIYIYIYTMTCIQQTNENDTSKCRIFIYFITREFSEIVYPFFFTLYCFIFYYSTPLLFQERKNNRICELLLCKFQAIVNLDLGFQEDNFIS